MTELNGACLLRHDFQRITEWRYDGHGDIVTEWCNRAGCDHYFKIRTQPVATVRHRLCVWCENPNGFVGKDSLTATVVTGPNFSGMYPTYN